MKMKALRKVSRRLGLVSVGLGGVIFLAAAPAQATPISYVINPGTSADLNGSVETITGSFTYNPTTALESAVDFTLTGPSPYAGTYIDNSTDISEVQAIDSSLQDVVCGSTGGETVCLMFTNPLNGVASDPLNFVGYGPTPDSPAVAFDQSPAGSASPGSPTPVPEPSTLALFGSGLGAFGLLGWRRKRKAQAVA